MNMNRSTRFLSNLCIALFSLAVLFVTIGNAGATKQLTSDTVPTGQPTVGPVYDANGAMQEAIVYSHEVNSQFIPATGAKHYPYDATAAMRSAIIYSNEAPGSSKRSLQEQANDFSAAFVAKDYDRLSSYFANDIVAMYPLDPTPVYGQLKNLEVWQYVFQVYESHPLINDGVEVANSKDVGYSYGRWAATGVPEMGSAAGRYIAAWVWTKSGWKITHLSAHIHEDILPIDIYP